MENNKKCRFYSLFVVLLFFTSCSQQKPTLLYENQTADLRYTKTLANEPALSELIVYALEHNSSLRSKYFGYQAALEHAAQDSALPDPKFTYGYFLNSIETRVGPQRHRVGLSQQIPWFGKLSLKEKIADKSAQAELYSFLVEKNKLVVEVMRLYFELSYLTKALEVTSANLELLKQWEEVVTQRYRSQSGNQADIIKTQIQLGTVEDKLTEIQELKIPLSARLNALLNRPSETSVTIPSHALINNFSEPNDKELLLQQLGESNPELLLLTTLIEAKKQGVDLASKQFLPDFTVGADYIVVGNNGLGGEDAGTDALQGMISFNLPLSLSKYDAGVRQTEKEQASLEEKKRGKTFELQAQYAQALFTIKNATRQISLYNDTLIPKAKDALETTFIAFEVGELAFLDLLDSERTLLEFQLSLARAKADLNISVANLLAILGDYSDKEQSYTSSENIL
jgi:outer membrane protein, heavy metal efflux system